MNPSHSLRFVRALTLAALVPGCAGTSAPAPAPITSSDAGTSDAADAAGLADADETIDDLDAHAFSSGPIAPPELPVGLA